MEVREGGKLSGWGEKNGAHRVFDSGWARALSGRRAKSSKWNEKVSASQGCRGDGWGGEGGRDFNGPATGVSCRWATRAKADDQS